MCEAFVWQASQDRVEVLASVPVAGLCGALQLGTSLAAVMQLGLCMFFGFIPAVKITQFPLKELFLNFFLNYYYFLFLLLQSRSRRKSI